MVWDKSSVLSGRCSCLTRNAYRKSQLAIEHCYRTVEQSPQTWVFWVYASNTTRLEQSFRDITDQAKIRGREDPQADIFKLVHDWLRDEKNGHWILVLDNADYIEVLQSSAKGVGNSDSRNALKQHFINYLPRSKHGSLLVTSREKSAALQLVDDNDIISIEPMDKVAAHALLRTKLGDEVGSDSDIAELTATLDSIPLALVQAAAYIQQNAPQYSVKQYLEEYRQSDSAKWSLLKHSAGNFRRDETASNSVLTTWQAAFDHIYSTRQSAADLLSLMSFISGHNIDDRVLRGLGAAGNLSAIHDDLLTLQNLSFIMRPRNTHVSKLYSLIQLATRMWLESKGQIGKWRKQFISNLSTEMPDGQYKNWRQCERVFSHTKAALMYRPEDKELLKKWALLLYKASWYALQQGRAKEAEEMAAASMDARRQILGEMDANTLDSMKMVGLALELRGKYKEAEAMHRKVMKIGQEMPEYGELDMLASEDNLGVALRSQGRYEEAEAIHRKVMKMRQELPSTDYHDILISMNNLGVVLFNQGRYEEAEKIHTETLRITEQVPNSGHLDVLISKYNLALVLERVGKYSSAGFILREAMSLWDSFSRMTGMGADHPVIITILSNYGSVLVKQGDYKMAEKMYRFALKAREREVGREYPHTLISANQLEVVLARLRERLAKDYIASFLAHDVEVRALCDSVLGRIDRKQFVDVGEQILGSYYLGLRKHATTEMEKHYVCLLESSSGRQKISEAIVDILKLDVAQKEEEIMTAVQDPYPKADDSMFKSIFKGISYDRLAFENLHVELLFEELESDDSLPNLEFLRDSDAFKVLLNDLRAQLLPQSLRDILQIAPYDSLWLFDQNNYSLSNQMKAFVEDFTMLEWNWWPLKPRMRNLSPGQTRLFWHCVSIYTVEMLQLILYSLVVRGCGKKYPRTTPI